MTLFAELLKEVQERTAELHISLARAKEVADRVNDQAFMDWIDAELMGYPTQPVPAYRHLNLPLCAEVMVPMKGRQWEAVPELLARRVETTVGERLSEVVLTNRVEEIVRITWSKYSSAVVPAGNRVLAAIQNQMFADGYPRDWVTQAGWLIVQDRAQVIVDAIRHELYNRLLALRKAHRAIAEETAVSQSTRATAATNTDTNTGAKYVDNSNRSVTINMGSGNTFHGPFVVAKRIGESFNTIGGMKEDDPLKGLLEALAKAVGAAAEALPEKEAGTLAKDLESIVTEATTDARKGMLQMLGDQIRGAAAGVKNSAVAATVTSALSSVLSYFKII